MEDENQEELQLLPSTSHMSSGTASDSSLQLIRSDQGSGSGSGSVDLQLSISLRPIRTAEALKWEAAEQIRVAAMEKAYAERVRELAKREMEMAELEFARARQMWERAREEMEKADRIKDRATRRFDSTCMEITCQSCSLRFRPY